MVAYSLQLYWHYTSGRGGSANWDVVSIVAVKEHTSVTGSDTTETSDISDTNDTNLIRNMPTLRFPHLVV